MFHRTYRASMPAGRLPMRHYARKLLSRLVFWTQWLLRLALCAFVWLAVFPFFNLFTLERFFWLVDLILEGLTAWEPTRNLLALPALPSGSSSPEWRSPQESLDEPGHDESRSPGSDQTASWFKLISPRNWFRYYSFQSSPAAHEADASYKNVDWNLVLSKIGEDIFQGIILTAVVVVVFVSIFLLREWIVQNMPQGPLWGLNEDQDDDAPVEADADEAPGELDVPLENDDEPEVPIAVDEHQHQHQRQHDHADANAHAHMREREQRELELRRDDLTAPFENTSEKAVPSRNRNSSDDFTQESSRQDDAILADGVHETKGQSQNPLLDNHIHQQELPQQHENTNYHSGSAVDGDLDHSTDLPAHPLADVESKGHQRATTPVPSTSASFSVQSAPDEAGLSFPALDLHDTPPSDLTHLSSGFDQPHPTPNQLPSLEFGSGSRPSSTDHAGESNQSNSKEPADLERDEALRDASSQPVAPAHDVISETNSVHGPDHFDDEWNDEEDDEEGEIEAHQPATPAARPPALGELGNMAPFYADALNRLPGANVPLPRQTEGVGEVQTVLIPVRPPANFSGGMQGTQVDYDNYISTMGDILTHDGLQGMSIAAPVSDDNAPRAENVAAPGAANVGRVPQLPEAQGNDDEWEDVDELEEDDPPPGAGWDEEAEEAEERMMQDDMDGIFEAIGLHGPIAGLIQNLAILSALCTFGLVFLGALPLLLGRVVGTGEALLSLAKLPVQILRLVTDPFFDAVISFGERILARLLGPDLLASWTPSSAPAVVPAPPPPSSVVQTSAGTASPSELADLGSHYFDLVQNQAWHYVSVLQASLREAHDRFQLYIMGTTIRQRVTGILLGYSYYVLILLLHLNLSTRMNWRMDRWLLQWTKSQLVVIKVGGFIGIELLVFPLGCGVLFGLATLPFHLGPEPWGTDLLSALRAHREAFWAAPVTWTFLHWVAGTLYMFFFAQSVSLTRDIARPGVLCWIRDPNDPNFQPVKEILERRSVTQLAKTGSSILIYAIALFSTVAVPCAIARYALPLVGVHVVPIQLHYSAYASFGSELAVILTLFPWLIKKASPPRVTKRLYSRWWKFTARRLHLSSFLRGGRHLEEEGWPTGDEDLPESTSSSASVPSVLEPHVANASSLASAASAPRDQNRAGTTASAPAISTGTGTAPVDLGIDRSIQDVLRQAHNALASGTHAAAHTNVGWAATASRTRREARLDADTPPEGSFARVPADNNAIMSTALVIRTNARGIPLDQQGMEQLRAQHAAMARQRARGGEKAQYTIVYVPPRLRLRLWTFVLALTVSLALALTLAGAVPLVVGRTAVRWLYALGPDVPPHDGHALFVGGCFCLAGVALGRAVHRAYRARSRAHVARHEQELNGPEQDGALPPAAGSREEEEGVVEDSVRAAPRWVPARLARVCRWARTSRHAQAAWSAFTWLLQIAFKRGFVALLCGLAIQQYIEYPLRYGLRPADPPHISLGQAWVTGLMAWRLAVFWVPDRVYDLWLGERPQYKTLAYQLAFLLLYPPGAAWAGVQLFALWVSWFGTKKGVLGDAPDTHPDTPQGYLGPVLFRQTYFTAGWQIILYMVYLYTRTAMDTWADAIRDEVYLQSTQLQDFESPAPSSVSAASASRARATGYAHGHGHAPGGHAGNGGANNAFTHDPAPPAQRMGDYETRGPIPDAWLDEFPRA